MNDEPTDIPSSVLDAHKTAAEAGFTMSCDSRTGALLRTLAASKPGGRILELGTGVGVGAAWLLAGMTGNAHLVTVEADSGVAMIARELLGDQQKITMVTADADIWLDTYNGPAFDLAFIDCRPGKFRRRRDLLNHLTDGGLWVGDDLLPQPTWPADHQPRVDQLLDEITTQTGLVVTVMNWSSGLAVGARVWR